MAILPLVSPTMVDLEATISFMLDFIEVMEDLPLYKPGGQIDEEKVVPPLSLL